MGTACSGEGRHSARLRGWAAAVVLGVLALALGLSASASAAQTPAAHRVTRVCGLAPPGGAACAALRLLPASLTPADLRPIAHRQADEAAAGEHPAVTDKNPFPGYLTPQDLRTAYALPAETASAYTQTIAVIDAFDDPTAEADLGVFDEEFGLPACTSANGCFRKLNQEGQESPRPAENGGWAGEISIDVQMAHAICQSCRVLLVEAKSAAFADLGAAVNAAVSAGATEISNSYTTPEELSIASLFTEINKEFYEHPGIVVTAASGDCGYLNEACPGEPATANFPADSPAVIGVGGTALTENKETWSSTAWGEGGSGCSEIFAAPAWQSAVANFSATGCGGERSVADVAAIGDPSTGVDVYDSTPEGNGDPTGWGVWGGTSVASPIIAAEFALAGGAHDVAFPATTLYAHLGEADALYDVTSGSNGSCGVASACQAVVGYDGPTGVGSPIGLGAFSTAGSPANTSLPGISGTAEEGQTLTETPGSWTNDPTSLTYQWLRCSTAGSGCSAITGATGKTYTPGAVDVGRTIRVQETATNSAGMGAPASSTQSPIVLSDALELTGFTPSSGITGSAVTIEGAALGAVSKVEFGSLTAQFTVLSATRLEAIVPDGASKGKISLSTAADTVTSKAKFTATLSVTAFSPQHAGAGTEVTIKGIGFNTSSTLSFDGVPASVKFVSAKKLKATVPTGAGTGAIAVTNTAAPLGTVFSANSFTP